MTKDDLDELSLLDSAATSGPWYVGRFDDEHFMSAVSIEGYISDDQGQQNREVIAATLIQQPDYVVPSDGRYSENAAFFDWRELAYRQQMTIRVDGLRNHQSIVRFSCHDNRLFRHSARQKARL